MSVKSLIAKALKGGYAVYWEKTEPDETGQQTWADPIEIPARWTERNELMQDGNGEEFTSKGNILVDRKLKLNAVLWKGRLADVTSEDDPFANEDAAEIRRVDVVPADFGQTFNMYKAFV
jgi:hypothetical protein